MTLISLRPSDMEPVSRELQTILSQMWLQNAFVCLKLRHGDLGHFVVHLGRQKISNRPSRMNKLGRAESSKHEISGRAPASGFDLIIRELHLAEANRYQTDIRSCKLSSFPQNARGWMRRSPLSVELRYDAIPSGTGLVTWSTVGHFGGLLKSLQRPISKFFGLLQRTLRRYSVLETLQKLPLGGHTSRLRR